MAHQHKKARYSAAETWMYDNKALVNLSIFKKPSQETLHQEYFIISFTVIITIFWVELPTLTAVILVVNNSK